MHYNTSTRTSTTQLSNPASLVYPTRCYIESAPQETYAESLLFEQDISGSGGEKRGKKGVTIIYVVFWCQISQISQISQIQRGKQTTNISSI